MEPIQSEEERYVEHKMPESGFKHGSSVVANVVEQGFVTGSQPHTVVRGAEDMRVQRPEETPAHPPENQVHPAEQRGLGRGGSWEAYGKLSPLCSQHIWEFAAKRLTSGQELVLGNRVRSRERSWPRSRGELGQTRAHETHLSIQEDHLQRVRAPASLLPSNSQASSSRATQPGLSWETEFPA